MATTSRDPSRPLADDGSSNLLLEAGRTIRDTFHVLAAMSLLFMAASLPFVIVATATSWTIAWAPLVLATAPLWAATVAGADGMLAGMGTPWRSMTREVRRLAIPGLRIGIAPALCGSVLLAIAERPNGSPAHDLLVVAVAGLSVAVLMLLIPAFPIAVRTGVSGPALWQASAYVVVRRPAQVLGTVTLAGMGIWLTLALGPAVLLGTAPLAVLVAAITLPDPG